MKITTLAAGAVAALGITAVSASAQAPGWNGGFDPVPEGSYQRSCRDITAMNGWLYARCKDRSNRLVNAEIDTRRCNRARIENVNGRLQCEGYGGGGGWNGGGNGPVGLIVYENPDYRGRSLEIRGEVPSLVGSGLDDQITAIRVISGRWELCVGQNFTGQCRIFDRSDPNLNLVNFNDKVSSIRRVRR